MVRYVLAIIVVAPLIQADDLAADRGVRQVFWHMLSETRYGFSHEEAAAFIVRSGETLSAIEWPSDGVAGSARWTGAIPRGVVAIVHTHPNWMSSPSPIDVHTARASRLPVYVVTRSRIAKTFGTGPQLVVVDGDWKPMQ